MTNHPNQGETGRADTKPGSDPDGVGSAHLVYANGVQVGLSNADITLTLKVDNKHTHNVHLSYTLAKTLRDILKEVIDLLESSTKQQIMTTRQTDDAFKRQFEKQEDTANARPPNE